MSAVYMEIIWPKQKTADLHGDDLGWYSSLFLEGVLTGHKLKGVNIAFNGTTAWGTFPRLQGVGHTMQGPASFVVGLRV